MTPSVRRIRPDDVAALRRVRLAALADSPAAFGSTFERESLLTESDWEERATRSSSGDERATFFAVDGDAVIGLVVGYRSEVDAASVDLLSMWTDPAVRRTGVGRQLVSAVIEFARQAGASKVDLWVTKGNSPAENLYRAMGFVETGDYQPLPSDPCRDETRMRLVL